MLDEDPVLRFIERGPRAHWPGPTACAVVGLGAGLVASGAAIDVGEIIFHCAVGGAGSSALAWLSSRANGAC